MTSEICPNCKSLLASGTCPFCFYKSPEQIAAEKRLRDYRLGRSAVRRQASAKRSPVAHATAATSKAAFAGITHIDAQGQVGKILAYIGAHPEGCSRRQVSQATGVGYYAVCGRVDELLGRSKHSAYKSRPLLAELPTTARNRDTGVQAKQLVLASQLPARAPELAL
jgi:hypothetical protein